MTPSSLLSPPIGRPSPGRISAGRISAGHSSSSTPDSSTPESSTPESSATKGRLRSVLALLVGVGLLVGLTGSASGSDDPVATARRSLAESTAARRSAEQRVTEAESRLESARTEADRLRGVDQRLTEDLAAARRDLREYAIAAYIDGGQSELFRATLNAEQAQALAWQSSMLLGQSVSADEAAERFQELKSRNEPATLDAATEVDRATSAVREAQYDLIQAAAFERDAEATLAQAIETARREAAERAAAQRAARAEAAAVTAKPASSSPQGNRPAGSPALPDTPPAESGQAASGNPTAAESATLARIRRCESRGNYSIVSGSGRYRGAYQFDSTTWRGVGGSGDPAAASPAEQDYRALLLLRLRGTRPWPICGR